MSESLPPDASAHHAAVAVHIAGGQRNGKSLARMSFRTSSSPWETRPYRELETLAAHIVRFTP